MPPELFSGPGPPASASRAWTLLAVPPTFQIRTPVRSPRMRRNINLLSIDYAFRPHLRSRLTLGGYTFPRKPWAFGEQDFHLLYRYSSRHIHFLTLQRPFRDAFTADRNALLPLAMRARSFGFLLIPDHYRRRTPRPVSCYALFKWWLLLSQHPGCHSNPTSFRTEQKSGALAGGLDCFPFVHENCLPWTDSHASADGIRSLVAPGTLAGPKGIQSLYPHQLPREASPKAISERTSYLPV